MREITVGAGKRTSASQIYLVCRREHYSNHYNTRAFQYTATIVKNNLYCDDAHLVSNFDQCN